MCYLQTISGLLEALPRGITRRVSWSGWLLRIVRDVTKASIPYVGGRYRFVSHRIRRRGMWTLGWLGTFITPQVLICPDDQPIDEKERQAEDNETQDTEQHCYFLLTGL
jgi:hypothetical protein